MSGLKARVTTSKFSGVRGGAAAKGEALVPGPKLQSVCTALWPWTGGPRRGQGRRGLSGDKVATVTTKTPLQQHRDQLAERTPSIANTWHPAPSQALPWSRCTSVTPRPTGQAGCGWCWASVLASQQVSSSPRCGRLSPDEGGLAILPASSPVAVSLGARITEALSLLGLVSHPTSSTRVGWAGLRISEVERSGHSTVPGAGLGLRQGQFWSMPVRVPGRQPSAAAFTPSSSFSHLTSASLPPVDPAPRRGASVASG